MSSETVRPARQKGFLGFVERVGNLLPDPTIIFIYLIIVLMLVSAFAGFPETMAAYAAAVEHGYRFFSYGDAMFITRNPAPTAPGESTPTDSAPEDHA